MRATSALIILTTLLTPFVTADLHTAGICVNKVGGANVYSDAATKAACSSYKKRNTGDKPWDRCPDCAMKNSNGLNVCESGQKHIGGDEWEFYCKQNKASPVVN